MLSIIIPCYNGTIHVENGNIERVYQYMEHLNCEYEIIVVNDGSKDDSLNALNKIDKHDGKIRVVSYEINRGKGFAIKTGIMNAKGDTLFMDIDLATDLNAIPVVLENKNKYKFIIASRNLDGSVGGKDKPLIRNIMSFVSSICVKIIGGVYQKDTQCGFKYMESETAKFIASKQIIERWAFDVEYLYIAL